MGSNGYLKVKTLKQYLQCRYYTTIINQENTHIPQIQKQLKCGEY